MASQNVSLPPNKNPQQVPPEMGGNLGAENQVLTLEMFPFPDLHPQVEVVLEIEWQPSRDPPPNSPDPHQEGRAAPGLHEPSQGVDALCDPKGGCIPTRRKTDPGRAHGGL